MKSFNRQFYKNNVLKKITSKIKKHEIGSFDCETHGYKNRFIQGGVIINNEYKSFLDRDDMINFIHNNSNSKTTIYATNLMFDFECLYYEHDYWDKFHRIMRNGNMITAKYENVKYSDSLNYSPSSVKQLGKLLGLEKLRYNKMIGKIPKSKSQWYDLVKYNKRDCEITKKFIEQFQEVCNQLGCEMKLTIASTALDLYRRKYMPCDIYKEPFKCKDFIFESYYGGRTENFKRGKLEDNRGNQNKKSKVYYWYDYASAYPKRMTNKFPLPSSAVQLKSKNGNLNYSTIKNYMGVSDVIVECPYMKIPILPYREDGKMIMPYGTWRGTYTHHELNYAVANGYKIKKIFRTVYYKKSFYPFKKYVETLYKLRLKYKSENNDIYSIIIKLLMNSLYGKFGTRSMNEINFMKFRNDKTCQYSDDEILGMQVTNIKDNVTTGYKEEQTECNQNYVLPILPSYVTSYQRVELHKALIELDGLYCDTDSILSEKIIKTGNQLGDLQLEKTITKGILIRPKLYAVYDKNIKMWNRKAKGIRGMNEEVFNLILKEERVKQIKFTKVKEALRQRYTANQKRTMYKLQDLEDNKRDWKKPFSDKEIQDSKPKYINDTTRKQQQIKDEFTDDNDKLFK